ncbi:carbonic anhydrase [Streptomyces sp. HU2014]|uniref:Carbonic anhydrase n=1 Tax=Streptomyces albireticuli TaxID=1940 RepID=A0A1Z2KV11_9ACTN|nr:MULTISPECIES: carbonic anhydrase [Streptomyces]ARZ65897.1 carbonic anhydrase [Streptomyces albireticuli]UQI46170.1 carbonic anhydrase [Streptomyces sp. HU2014]
MKSLVESARSFSTHVAERADEFRVLEAGQSPQALFITCSDSRVVPALITGARPGELFELRTAGNIVPEYRTDVPAGEMATIEYAVRVLGVRDIVVCGHSHCGAVGALVRGDDLSAAPAVRGWLERAAPRPAREAVACSPDVAEAVQGHAVAQVERLRAYPCVRERLEDGTLSVHAWYYEVHTGLVSEYHSGDEWFRPL